MVLIKSETRQAELLSCALAGRLLGAPVGGGQIAHTTDALCHPRSHEACCLGIRRRTPDMARQRFKILHDGGEMELIACARKAAQHRFGLQLLELAVLVLQRLQLTGVGDLHPAIAAGRRRAGGRLSVSTGGGMTSVEQMPSITYWCKLARPLMRILRPSYSYKR